MKKTLAALAVLGAFAGSAAAADVTLYGVVDLGLNYQYSKVGDADSWTLIFGNEGSGLPPEFSRLGQPVRIPSSNKVDSLNLSIAAAIGIYAFARR